ncbi:MAG: HD domain-containing phosphohydrolase [Candidatus Kapaibacterium sp.]|jgi:putative two-component system response regulator|nr:response regulator [Candidatus Kapabacteria bacterium]
MSNIKVLVIDDEPATLLTISKLIEKSFSELSLFTAKDGNDGLLIIKKEKPEIVISDISMPGQSGLELLDFVRKEKDFKDTYFVLITAHDDDLKQDQSTTLAADDYIAKPFSNVKLLARIKAAIRVTEMQKHIKNENNLLLSLANQLEQEIQDMIKLSVKFLEARIPSSTDILRKVAECSVWIAKSYGDFSSEQIRDLEIAAYLCHAGRIYLNDNFIKEPIMKSGRPTNEIMYQVPKLSKDILGSVQRFSEVSKTVYHIYENFDGSGIPERLKSWQIPFESRIIRVVLDYQELVYQYKKSPGQAVDIIKKEASRLYDQRVTILLEHYVKSFEISEKIENEVAVLLTDLKENMKITRDIYTEKGLKLLPSGAVLTNKIIEKILMHNTTDSILGNIYINRF